MPSVLTVIPSARRLMESLRDIGYELPAAVADLVDNSIDADATEVDVTAVFAGEDSWIRIADNGDGMETARMNEAMRYGTDRDYDDAELGKFGLGLKTASLSQCRRLTVATRTNPSRRDIEIRRWDLDHVMEEDVWELMRLSTSEVRPELVEPLQDAPGTVVMWEVLDRILDYKLPTGRAAEHGLGAICRDIEEHLAMVFHRFLAQQAGARSAADDHGSRQPRRCVGSVRQRRAGNAEAPQTDGATALRGAHAQPPRAAVHPAQPGAVLNDESVGSDQRTQEVEPPTGILYLPRRAHDSERRMEPTANA